MGWPNLHHSVSEDLRGESKVCMTLSPQTLLQRFSAGVQKCNCCADLCSKAPALKCRGGAYMQLLMLRQQVRRSICSPLTCLHWVLRGGRGDYGVITPVFAPPASPLIISRKQMLKMPVRPHGEQMPGRGSR